MHLFVVLSVGDCCTLKETRNGTVYTCVIGTIGISGAADGGVECKGLLFSAGTSKQLENL